MPSGKKHDRITLYCLPVIIVGSIILTQNYLLTIIIAIGFLFSGFMFGPDLDIYSVQYQRWKWLRFIWLPYQKILKHRSWFSHGFLVGTIIRLIYFLIIVITISILVVGVCQLIWGFHWNWHHLLIKLTQKIRHNLVAESISLFVGLELGAMSHYVADSWNSFLKLQRNSNNQPKSSNNKKKRQKRIKKRKL